MNKCPECNFYLGSAGHAKGCSFSGLSPVPSNPLLALQIRNLIADKEWLTAAANHDVAKFGQWQCDWQEGIRDVNRELHELWEEAN